MLYVLSFITERGRVAINGLGSVSIITHFNMFEWE